MTVPIFSSPALPSELISYILNHHLYPTTLIIGSTRADFLASLIQDIQQQQSKSHQTISDSSPEDQPEDHQGEKSPHEGITGVKHPLLYSPLHQLATSRHIRIIYIPTVTHLRAYLSVFSPDDSRVSIPPTSSTVPGPNQSQGEPHIILYGFLDLHRDTSEWSAQGLCNSSSTLVELAHRLSWQTLIVEPRGRSAALGRVLRETVPILSGGARRLGPGLEEGAWTGRTVEIGRVLGRWFRFQRAPWDIDDSHD